MREVLSRGKRADNGKWIYGFYFYDNRPSGGHFIMYFDGYKQIVEEVIPETVGQSTGLTDKNGVRVFEGDVVSVHDALLRCDKKYHEFIGFVSFDRASFMICGDDGMTHYRWADYDIEVIGSVYDNPELLEGN